MSYTFQFFTPVVKGDRCDFYAGFPASASMLAGEAPPLSGVGLGEDLMATLSNAQGNTEIAIVLSRKGSVYGRTNSMPLSRFSKTEANPIYVTSVAQEYTLEQLKQFVPQTPLTADNITITSASIALRPGQIVLSGSAKSDGWWFFDFTLSYEYICGLVPVTTPIWFVDEHSEYVDIDEIDFSVTGKNVVQDILLLMGKGSIRSKLESALVDNLNAEIRDQLAVASGEAATVSAVDITTTSATVSITLASPDSMCPLAMSMRSPGQAVLRDRTETARMWRIRDQVLAPSASGRAYIAMLGSHRTELWQLFATHPDKAMACYAALDRVVAEAGRGGMASLSVSAEAVSKARVALAALATVASPSLKHDLLAFEAKLGTGSITAAALLAAP